jgi:asparagine synthase (glutamine-hydrolysing)
LIARDPLGARPLYFTADGRSGERARPLAGAAPRFDRDGVLHAWGEGGRAERSCFAGVHRLAPGHRLRVDDRGLAVAEAAPLPPAPPSLEAALLESLAPLVDDSCALWLSGGLDSALILALARELGTRPVCYVLAPSFGGDYDESAAALALARSFSLTPTLVRVAAEDFVRALPACIRSTEAPLWNLHPVQKRILAERTRADGFARALTGDGADEAFAPAFADDYLPLATAIARDAGVAVVSPFCDARFVAWARAHSPDPRKKSLRALARTRLPRDVCELEKRSRLAPPLDVSRFFDAGRAAAFAAALALGAPRADVKWATLCLCAQEFDVAVDEARRSA